MFLIIDIFHSNYFAFSLYQPLPFFFSTFFKTIINTGTMFMLDYTCDLILIHMDNSFLYAFFFIQTPLLNTAVYCPCIMGPSILIISSNCCRTFYYDHSLVRQMYHYIQKNDVSVCS